MPVLEIVADTKSIESALDGMFEDMTKAARPAAQAGAEVLYQRVKQNVAALGRKTGNLDRAIYQAFMDADSTGGAAAYRVSWNKAKATHGQLVEFGHIQAFKSYIGSDGRWHTMVRPEAIGKKVVRLPNGKFAMVDDPKAQRIAKPKRRADYATKARYYVPLEGGPRQVPARPFIRSAASAFPQALKAAEDRFFAELKR